MASTTLNPESLISGYKTYSFSAKLALTDFDTNPLLSPTPFVKAASDYKKFTRMRMHMCQN